MKIDRMKLVCFSPTMTTRKVVERLGKAIGGSMVEIIDITTPSARELKLTAKENELVVVGVPVYMGRVPALSTEWLAGMKLDNSPVVCVVVYGNRAYENSLLELSDTVTECGGRVIAGGGFIGEHSFTCPERPVAIGRPDASDDDIIAEFGRKIAEKIGNMSAVDDIPEVVVPGERPYQGVTEIWDVDFIHVDDKCSNCGHCAGICPAGAISIEDARVIDIKKCISCCACVKNCPVGARSIKPGPVEDASKRLFNLYSERKEPEYFV